MTEFLGFYSYMCNRNIIQQMTPKFNKLLINYKFCTKSSKKYMNRIWTHFNIKLISRKTKVNSLNGIPEWKRNSLLGHGIIVYVLGIHADKTELR